MSPTRTGASNSRWPLTGRATELDVFSRALSSRSCTMFVLYGQAGVGKSRLGDAFLERADQEGHPTFRVLASAAAASMPLGALAPVLPGDADASTAPGALLAAVQRSLGSLGSETPVALVDDAHLLDPSSAVLLTQLVAADALMVVATIREGEALPDVVAGWWRTRDAIRLDVGDLDRSTVRALLRTVLDGPVGTDTLHAIYQASDGNPLVMREHVQLALAEGRLRADTGTWRLVGDIPPSHRLNDLLVARLSQLDPGERAILDQLALCSPLGTAELVGEVHHTQIEDLEHAGLVREVVSGLRHQLVLAHPLYGEVLRAEIAATSRRAILLAVADRTVALGGRRREDARRVATWRLDGGGTPDPTLLRQAALVARNANDFGGVERLASVLRQIDPTVEAAILLGEARFELGDFAGADVVLAEPAPPATSPTDLAQRAHLRAKNLQWGLCDWQQALRVVREAQAAAGPEVEDELNAQEGAVMLFSGRPKLALEVLDRISSPAPSVAVQVAIDRSPALALLGRPDEAIDVARRAFADHVALVQPVGLAHPGTHVVNQAFAMIEAGRLGEARELSLAGYEVAVADRIPVAQIWFALMLGKVDLLRGRITDGRGWYREGASTARLHRFRGPLSLAVAGEALGEAMLGHPGAAASAIDELETLPPFGFLASDQVIGRAWSAWADGQPTRAREMLLAEAERAIANSNRASAAWLWHDAARLGSKGLGPRLTDLAAGSRSALISVRAAHVVALDAHDAPTLTSVSSQLEDLGMDLVAAEAANSAADAHRTAGDHRASAAAAKRSADLASRCQGATSPGLTILDAVVPLSRREREVALLASQGLSSQEIADRLYLSVRTVDNHLQRSYAKLGLTGRDQLAAALGTP